MCEKLFFVNKCVYIEPKNLQTVLRAEVEDGKVHEPSWWRRGERISP